MNLRIFRVETRPLITEANCIYFVHDGGGFDYEILITNRDNLAKIFSFVGIDDASVAEDRTYSSDKIEELLLNKVAVVVGKQLTDENYSLAEKDKLAGIADNANKYVHPTGDGNLHVPETGENGSGRVLMSGSTPGELIWTALTKSLLGLGFVENTADANKSVHSASQLTTARQINGTPFEGTTDITTENWGKSRNITIGAATKTVNGSENVTFTLAEMGVESGLLGKVDKIDGYGLSQENFTASEKAKLAILENPHFKGTYASLSALSAAYPIASPGDYADVDGGAGSSVSRHIWDNTDQEWIAQSGEVAPVTAGQVKTLYESNPDTNAFTDAEKTKLSTVESGANNYIHPGTDGNLHVPATGTASNGKFLMAGSTAGAMTWESLTKAMVGLNLVDNTADASKVVLSASKLTTARTINGTSFDGTANIVTAVWGSSRTLTIGSGSVEVDGSANVTLSLVDIGVTALLANKVDKIDGYGLSQENFSLAEKTKLTSVESGANNYIHPTSDGNIHVPATGTTNNGNVLMAGSTPGAMSWTTLTKAMVGLGNADNTADAVKSVASAAALTNTRTINGTNFNGTANITTATWGTSRNITIGNTAKSINGSSDVTWTLAEIGVTALLADKVDKVAGYGLSQANFTTEEKNKLASLESSRWKGSFASLTALQTAYPTSTPGAYADVDGGVGSNIRRFIWDESDLTWVEQGGVAPSLTAAQVKTLYESNADTNAFSNAYKTKLDGIAAGANNYVHPTGDGNLHVPATGTVNNGKVLTAGATAGSLSWTALTKASVGLSNVDDTADAVKSVASATTLKTARTINETSFNGSANIVTAIWGETRVVTIGNTSRNVNGGANITWTLDDIGVTVLLDNKVDKITGYGLSQANYTSTEKTKLAAIADGANNYVHPTGDGNIHMPATGTVSDGKALIAGPTAGSASWQTLTKSMVGLANVDNTADASKSVASAATLTTARTINGTSFNGSANITTANWGTARTITIGSTGKSVNGSANVTWTLDELGVTALLANKVNVVAGYGLSQENFTAAEKTKLASLESSHYKGNYATLTALQTAYPSASAGDYADVDSGAGSNVRRFIWDTSDTAWVEQSGIVSALTAAQVKTLYESNADTNAFSNAYKTKLDGIAAGANNYIHPTGDGNLHVPATGTTSNGYVLVAGATAGSMSWTALTKAMVGLSNVDNVADSSKSVASAATLTTSRTIALSGAATGTATSFNGSANITIPVTDLNATNLSSGTVPDARLSGTYTDVALKLTNNKSVFTTPSTGSTNTVARTVFGLAEYRSTSSTTTGAIVFIAPNTLSTIMHQLTIDLHEYSVNLGQITVQGYRTSGTWQGLFKVADGVSSPMVRFGVTPDGKNCLILGDVNTVWAYPHVSITKALFSHTGLDDSYCTGWTTALVTDLTGYTNITADIPNAPMNGRAIGTTSPSTGSFTDLTASGTFSGGGESKRQSVLSVVGGTYSQIPYPGTDTALVVGYAYRVRLSVSGTGTATGATYLVWQGSSSPTWAAQLVSRAGATSMHPSVRTNGTQMEVTHAASGSTYTVHCNVEKIYVGNTSIISPLIFGLEGIISYDASTDVLRSDVNLQIANGCTLGDSSTDTHTITGTVGTSKNDNASGSAFGVTRIYTAAASSVYSLRSVCVPTFSSNSTGYDISADVTIKPIVNSGYTRSGYSAAFMASALRNYNAAGSNDGGTLSVLYGESITFGHYNTNPSATPITTQVSGFILNSYSLTGTIGELNGIYIPAIQGTLANVTSARGLRLTFAEQTGHYNLYINGTAQNYIAGKVGIGTTAVSVPANQLSIAASGIGIGITNTLVGSAGSPSWAGIKFYGWQEGDTNHVASIEASNEASSNYNGGIRVVISNGSTSKVTRLVIPSTGEVLPGATDAQDLGKLDTRWKTVVTKDVSVDNEKSISVVTAKLPTILPVLMQDFANSQVVDPRLTFTRSTIGTYIDRYGNVKTAAINEPRPYFDPVTGECLGILYEEARTNIITYSCDFTQWTKSNTGTGAVPIVTPDAALAPDLSMTADRIDFSLNGGTSSTDMSVLTFPAGSVVGQPQMQAIWLKTVDGSTKTLRFDFSGTLPTIPGYTTSYITVTGKWKRFVVGLLSPTDTSRNFRIGLRGGGGTSDTASVYAWNGQVEQNVKTITSDIITNGSAIQRGSDYIEVSPTFLAEMNYQGDATVVISGRYFTTEKVDYLFSASAGSSNDEVSIFGNTSAVSYSCYSKVGNVVQANHSLLTYAANTDYAYALAWGSGRYTSSRNGVTTGSTTGALIPSITKMGIGGQSSAPVNTHHGVIQKFALYTTELTEANLNALTSQ